MKKEKIAWKKVVKKLSPYTVRKGILYLRHYGLKEFAVKLAERFEESDIDYHAWFLQHRVTQEELQRQRQTNWKNPILISVVVPVYQTPEPF